MPVTWQSPPDETASSTSSPCPARSAVLLASKDLFSSLHSISCPKSTYEARHFVCFICPEKLLDYLRVHSWTYIENGMGQGIFAITPSPLIGTFSC